MEIYSHPYIMIIERAMVELHKILSSIPIFARLSEENVTTISEYSNLRHFEVGQSIFQMGDPGDKLYIIHKGEVSINRKANGKSIELARFVEGDVFGEMDFFQNSPRNAAARAETDAALLQFPKRGYNFHDLLYDQPAISAQLLHSFLTVVAGRIRTTNELVSENSPLIQQLRKQVYGDKLTGLFNKTYLEEQFQSFCTKKKAPVCLLMVKPDNFKYINDTYGHEAGDQTLRILSREYRKTNVSANGLVRFMGNEFGFVLINTSPEEAVVFSKELQERITLLDLSEVIGQDPFHLTLSIGIAVYPDHGKKAEEIIQKAHELPLIGRGRGGGKILFPENKEERDS